MRGTIFVIYMQYSCFHKAKTLGVKLYIDTLKCIQCLKGGKCPELEDKCDL